MTLFLHGLGHFHPENEITNRFLEELDIGTNDEWILERVGIRARRTALPLDYIRTTRNRDVRGAAEATLYTTAELGRRAAEIAIARAGVDRAEIGMVIAGSSAPDFVSPADACNVAARLGLEVPAFDVNSACTSLLVQIHLLSLMDPEKLPPFVLLVAPDSLTKTVDYSDRSAAVLWGDAAAAAVVSTRVPGRARLLGSTLASRPSAGDKVVVARTGHFNQQGRTVQAFAIKESARCYERLRERLQGLLAAGRRFHHNFASQAGSPPPQQLADLAHRRQLLGLPDRFVAFALADAADFAATRALFHVALALASADRLRHLAIRVRQIALLIGP